MQTVAIVQNADFSPNQTALPFGMSNVGVDSKSSSFGDISLAQTGKGKESFESMIQKASFEKSAQEENRIAGKEPCQSNESRAEKTEAAEKKSEIPTEKADAVVAKDEGAADESVKAEVKSSQPNSLSQAKNPKAEAHLTASKESKNASEEERLSSEDFVARHSLSEAKRLSDSSKVQKDGERAKGAVEDELLEKIVISDDEYALLAAENVANFATVSDESAISPDENFIDSDYLLSTDDFSVDERGEIGEDAHIKSRFYLDGEKKILVSDYRTEKSVEKSGEANAKSDNARSDALRFSDVKVTGDNTVEIAVDLNAAEMSNSNILSTNSQTASANGSDFQAMLSNQIQQNASEFVRAGNIVLRDNDSGQIKLVLNPENLGNVKIDLQISDKNITGRILVASSHAYNAFKESADSLRNAFISSGFESASFDLNYSGQGAEQNNGRQNQGDNAHYVISRTYGEYAVAGFDDLSDSAHFDKISLKNAINIVA